MSMPTNHFVELLKSQNLRESRRRTKVEAAEWTRTLQIVFQRPDPWT